MTIGSFGHGVDLNLSSILLLEDLVQVNEDIRSLLLGDFTLETELFGDLESFGGAETIVKVNGSGDDRIGVIVFLCKQTFSFANKFRFLTVYY